jgi:hypothetical protein
MFISFLCVGGVFNIRGGVSNNGKASLGTYETMGMSGKRDVMSQRVFGGKGHVEQNLDGILDSHNRKDGVDNDDLGMVELDSEEDSRTRKRKKRKKKEESVTISRQELEEFKTLKEEKEKGIVIVKGKEYKLKEVEALKIAEEKGLLLTEDMMIVGGKEYEYEKIKILLERGSENFTIVKNNKKKKKKKIVKHLTYFVCCKCRK